MLIGVLPGLGPGGHDGDPAADRLQRRRPGLGDHHAGRHLLRRPVRRHHHLGAAALPGEASRWSPSSTASRWPSRARPARPSASRPSARSSAPPSRSSASRFLGPLVAGVAARLRPPEYAALALLGVLLVATIGNGNTIKALVAAALGLLLATVGRDSFTGADRFTFDSLQLADGIDFVVVAMGLFGVGEILYNLEQRHGKPHAPAAVGNVWPSRGELKQSSGAIGRGSVDRLRPRRAARRRRGARLARRVRRGEAPLQGPPSGSAVAPSRASPPRSRPTTPPRPPRSSRC